jgi:serine/threonine protein kinase
MTEDELCEAARHIRDAADRAAYLDGACAADPALRERIEARLHSGSLADNFADVPSVAEGTTSDVAPGRWVDPAKMPPLTEGPGSRIEPFKLLQPIGEGGFGVVYMAEQEKPVRRVVALKIIKPGMDTAQVIARFESERQALALMDHPNIAKVLDAGATASGRPYFVMELVKGVSITEFCDKNHLAPEARLKLFLNVCHAIQHAHHKGIIHRDIKPSNVMVTLHDGVPVVKVIDFGVAKATVQKLTEKTLFTAYGQMIGTPAYMSPEQAEMSGLDIDTRSDVYSLGVLLYELLTGTTPLESKRLREAGHAEMQRLIREEEAPRPSTRLSSLGESAPVLADNRGLDVRRLVQLLKGDLDWIVMKALEKDRNRRYDTPGHLAEDIQRYLRREAVLARPPSKAYQFKKFAQRNRATVSMVVLMTTTLLAGSAIAAWQATRATRAEQTATKSLKEAETRAEEAKAATQLAEERSRQLLDAYQHAVSSLAERLLDLGATPPTCANLESLLQSYRKVVEQMGESRTSNRLLMVLHRNLSAAYQTLGDAKAARRPWEEMFRLVKVLVSPQADDDQTLEDMALAYDRLGDVCTVEGDVPGARQAYGRLLEMTKAQSARHAGDWNWQLALSDCHRNLGELELEVAKNPDGSGSRQWQ